MVLTILLGHVSLPGLWRVVMHSQYLSMKGMMSFTREQTTPLKPHIKHIALHSLNYSGKRTLSLENIVLGCSSWVLDLHVRFAKAVRHISFRSVDKTIKQWRMVELNAIQIPELHNLNKTEIVYCKYTFFQVIFILFLFSNFYILLIITMIIFIIIIINNKSVMVYDLKMKKLRHINISIITVVN